MCEPLLMGVQNYFINKNEENFEIFNFYKNLWVDRFLSKNHYKN
jgi:hypothetical protein